MEKGMRVLLVLFGALLVAPAYAEAKEQSLEELAPTHGYAYVSFSKGGAVSLAVTPVDGRRQILISDRAPAAPVAGAQAFARWLPAGQYRVSGFNGMTWSDGPLFEVEAGRITHLGDHVAVNVGGYEMVLVPMKTEDTQAAIDAATESISTYLRDTTPIQLDIAQVSPALKIVQSATDLGLIADLLLAYDRKRNKPSTLARLKSAKDAGHFLDIAREVVPPTQDEPARTELGALYFPADFGQLRRRDPNGEWSNVGMDTLRSILSAEYDNGRLLAGSDDGRIRSSFDGGRTWEEVKAFSRFESVIDIDHAAGKFVVLTTERFDDPDAPRSGGMLAAPLGTPSLRLRVYVGSDSSLSDLTVSREFIMTPRDQIGWFGARGQHVNGQYFVAVAPTLHRLDLSSGQWADVTPPDRAKVGGHRVDPDTGVVTTLWSQGAFSKVYVSKDYGESWSRIGRPPYVINDVQMDSPSEGWASRWNMNAFSGEWEMYRFAPAKDDWEKIGEAPFNCRPIRAAKDLPLICVATDASLFGLRDGEWQVEFSAQ
jgi:hypothetical protein